MITPHTLFHGAHLRADVFTGAPAAAAKAGNPRRLLVTFRQRVADPGQFSPPRPVQRFLRRGFTHLALQSRDNDWYINPETETFAACLRDFAADFGPRTAFGFSMGGYGALRFSHDLGLDQLIAVSPQVSIAPEVVPYDRRFRLEAAGFDTRLGDLTRHARPALQGVVLYDPFRRADRINAAMIARLFPRLALCRLGFGGHPATQVIRETVGFGAVQRLALTDRITRPQVLALHRKGRATSAAYWQARAEQCRANGHIAAAIEAEARHSALVDQT